MLQNWRNSEQTNTLLENKTKQIQYDQRVSCGNTIIMYSRTNSNILFHVLTNRKILIVSRVVVPIIRRLVKRKEELCVSLTDTVGLARGPCEVSNLSPGVFPIPRPLVTWHHSRGSAPPVLLPHMTLLLLQF